MYTNNYYDLDYDPAKNQINWKVKGFWESVGVVSNMEKHWNAVLAQAKEPGFNIFADLTEMKIPPQDVGELHTKVQKKIIELGVYKIAIVMAPSAITNFVVKDIGKKSGTSQLTKDFDDKAKAQAWLDEA